MRRAALLALAMAMSPGASACRGEPERITVAAPSSMRDVLPDLMHAFEEDSPGEIAVLMGGSGTLVDWIDEGKQVDVVLVGDGDNLARLVKGGHIDEKSSVRVASHRLVLVAVEPAPHVTFATLVDLPPTQPIAIGNPQYSSSGIHARALFERLGRWEDLRARMLLRGDVAAALEAARRGQAAAAVVYDTDVRDVPGLAVLDRAVEPPYPELWSALTGAGRGNDRARAFASFLRSAAGQRIFEAHGFARP